MVLVCRTLKLLRPGSLTILCRASAIPDRQASPAVQKGHIILYCTSNQPHCHPSLSHQQPGVRSRQLRTSPVRCQPSGEQGEVKPPGSMKPEKPPASPVDVAHTHALLDFMNAAWTPYHAVGKAKALVALGMRINLGHPQ